MKQSKILVLGTLAFFFTGTIAFAGSVSTLKTFAPNTPAKAEEVNENFNAVKSAVDDNDTKINENSTKIGANTTKIGANTTNISTNTGEITTNTSNINTNSANIAANSAEVAKRRRAGVQVTGFFATVNITSTTFAAIEILTVNDSSTFDVTLNSHFYIEKPGATTGRYEFAIFNGNCSGTFLGRTFWRPPSATSGFIADTISLTAFEASVTGPATYVLCGKKFDGGAPNAIINMRGLNAAWSP